MAFWKRTQQDKDTVSSGEDAPRDRGVERVGLLNYGLIKAPRITEKTSAASGRGVYVFTVREDANKPEIRRAIETRYGVDVVRVNMGRTPPKQRRRGRQIGWRSGVKKAIVTLKGGQTIDIA